MQCLQIRLHFVYRTNILIVTSAKKIMLNSIMIYSMILCNKSLTICVYIMCKLADIMNERGIT